MPNRNLRLGKGDLINMSTYTTHGTCAREINFDLNDGIVKNVKFIGGCPGNLQAISSLLEGMSADGTDQAFERAAAKISNARSEGQARTELARESLTGRLAGLDDAQASNNADDELARMEQRLGLASAPAVSSVAPVSSAATASTPHVPTATSEIDKQLQELEARVGGSGPTSS